MRPKIYISGPISGLKEKDVAKAFSRAATRITRAGGNPFNPSSLAELGPASKHYEFLNRDLKHLATCDMLAAMPGWGESSGCLREIWTASRSGIPCFLIDSVDSAVYIWKRRTAATMGSVFGGLPFFRLKISLGTYCLGDQDFGRLYRFL